MTMFKTKYRVVMTRFDTYKAEYRPWYSPFWFECFFGCTLTLEEAVRLVEIHKKTPVWSSDD